MRLGIRAGCGRIAPRWRRGALRLSYYSRYRRFMLRVMLIVSVWGNRMLQPLSCALRLGACVSVACAQGVAARSSGSYPSKPVRIVIPFSPGGGADALARTLQPALSAALGQPLVLDNRPGASSIIGSELALRAAPDGYTMVLITTTYTVTPGLVKKLPYDPVKDIAGASLAVTQPNVLVAHPSVPVKSLKDLVALAKAKPAQITYASGGSGSAPHLGGELLQMVA